MKLTGILKKQVEKADNKDEKRRLIEKAGMKLTDEELEMVSGGKSGALKPCVLYCAGVVARNGKVITQGCDFKETFPSYASASQTMTKKYKNLCPNCIRMCIKHPLYLREL